MQALQCLKASDSRPVVLSETDQVIKAAIGPLPLFKEDEEGEEGEAAAPLPTVQPATNRPAVLADGSYATQVPMRCSLPPLITRLALMPSSGHGSCR